MTTYRQIRKKLSKKFKVGDVVTWGNGYIAHRVVSVNPQGVWVDSTSSGYGTRQKDGTRHLFIPFAGHERYQPSGPPVHTDLEPDQDFEYYMRRWKGRKVGRQRT